ncbi:hypothetical protein DFS34DRAFT_187363 [Phlyctochytrium arcticum]|nr:hypothetical protein DFS34DRAFT_187363 [Phlyctochytrium arcticum]
MSFNIGAQIPTEVLLTVLLHLQPHYQRSEEPLASTPWTDGSCRGPREIWKCPNSEKRRKHNWFDYGKDSSKTWRGSHHPTIAKRKKGLPYILSFGAVCRHWRNVSHLHPFWTELSWHRLLPLSTCGLEDPTIIDDFFDSMASAQTRISRVRSIWLDLSLWSVVLGPKKLISLLSSIPHPELVHTLVLEMSWTTMGSTRLLKCIAERFSSVKKLHIGGIASPTVFQGYTTPMMEYLTKSLIPNHLTHLSVQGYGYQRSFTWQAYLELIRKHPGLQKVAIGYIDLDPVDLCELSECARELRSVAIVSSAIEYDTDRYSWGPTLAFTGIPTMPKLRCLSMTSLDGNGRIAPFSYELFLRISWLQPSKSQLEELRLPYLRRDIHDNITRNELSEIRFLQCQIHSGARPEEILPDTVRLPSLERLIIRHGPRNLPKKAAKDAVKKALEGRPGLSIRFEVDRNE